MAGNWRDQDMMMGGKLRKVDPEKITPLSDNPMPWYLRFGWWLAEGKCCPPGGYRNPFFFYFVGRMRKRRSDRWFAFLPWILLTLVQLAALGAGILGGLDFAELWVLLFAVDLMLVPTMGGLLMTCLMGSLVRSSRDQLMSPEVVLTPLSGREMVMGLMAFPVASFHWGMFLNSLTLFLTSIVTMSINSTNLQFQLLSTNGASLSSLVGVLFLLSVRYFLVRSMALQGSAVGLRASLMMEDEQKPLRRALYDYLFTYGFLFLILPFLSFFVAAFLGFFTMMLFGCISMLFFPIALLFMAGVAEENAGDVVSWVGDVKTLWVSVRGEQSLMVPPRFRDKWDMSLRKVNRHYILG